MLFLINKVEVVSYQKNTYCWITIMIGKKNNRFGALDFYKPFFFYEILVSSVFLLFSDSKTMATLVKVLLN